MDQAFCAVPRPAASPGHGSGGGGNIPQRLGGAGQGVGVHAKPGLGRRVVFMYRM